LYEASGPDGPPVTLVDQFQTQVVDLGTVRFFMVPASKNGEPIHDPVSHLTCYDIPEGQFGASVEVDNQFGPDFLGVGDPLALCVPTEKFPGPVPIPLLRDHYKCYEAGGYSMLGPSILLDQFQSWEPFLWDVMLFCAPVDKNGEGILNPYDAHLTCYLGDPPGISPGPVAVRNQFHEGDLFVDWPFALCVPSIKLGWSPL
jgi:hypothetical protein